MALESPPRSLTIGDGGYFIEEWKQSKHSCGTYLIVHHSWDSLITAVGDLAKRIMSGFKGPE
jgi:hypothetical protein